MSNLSLDRQGLSINIRSDIRWDSVVNWRNEWFYNVTRSAELGIRSFALQEEFIKCKCTRNDGAFTRSRAPMQRKAKQMYANTFSCECDRASHINCPCIINVSDINIYTIARYFKRFSRLSLVQWIFAPRLFPFDNLAHRRQPFISGRHLFHTLQSLFCYSFVGLPLRCDQMLNEK